MHAAIWTINLDIYIYIYSEFWVMVRQERCMNKEGIRCQRGGGGSSECCWLSTAGRRR